jgi:hypothetical protein
MNKDLIPAERIENKILLLRGQKVMLDRDLADLYGVRTSILKRAVTRNAERFPDDFMFLLNAEEVANWRCQFGTSNSDRMGLSVCVIFCPVLSRDLATVARLDYPSGRAVSPPSRHQERESNH